MKKRIISMLLVLCMVLALAPAGLTNAQASGSQSQRILEESSEISQSSAGTGNTATQEPAGTGSIITRAQWVQTLVDAFDMTVEEAHAPDNYFSDLTGDEDYYRDILVAVQFGVVDIPAGEAFQPNDAATREFAAQTLNSCLGFLRNEDEGYTFSEAAAVTYPDDIQISIDRGWFALSGGNFLPQQAITEAEEKVMLADIEQTLASRVIDTNYKNSYTFSTDVIEIPQGTDVEVVQDTVTIWNNPKTIKNGDVFVVWYNGIPCAYIANQVTKSGDTTTINVTAVEDDSAIVSADAQGILDTEFVQFVPAEGTEVVYVDEVTGEEYTDARQADAAIASHAATRGTKKLMTLQLKSEIDLGNGLSASVSVKLKDPVLEYKISSKDKTAYVTLTTDYEFSISAKAELIENAAVKKLRLGFWGCPGIGGIELAMVYSLAGSVTGTYTGTMCVGADYTSGAGFSIPKSFHSKGFSLVIEASLKAGLQVNLGINDIPGDLLSGYVYAEVGAKGSVKRTSYGDNIAPKTCVQTAIYLYLECGAKLTFKVGTYKSEYSREYKIWKDSNSPVRVVHHYEDGKEVCQCSRGNVYDNGYYTVGTSNYWGSGWSGGSGGSGYDKYGNPVPVYTYTVDEDGNATITGYNGGGASVVIPETLDGHTVVTIGNEAFRGNSTIHSLTCANTITRIGAFAFAETGITSLTLPSSVKSIGRSILSGNAGVKHLEIPKGVTSMCETPVVTTIGALKNSAIESVVFEEGMTTIPAYALEGATHLTTVSIPDSVTEIGQSAFRDCTALQEIKIPQYVTKIGAYAFEKTGLTSLTLPSSVTNIGRSILSGNTGVKYLEIPKGVTSMCETPVVTTIGALKNSAIESVVFEEGMTTIPAYALEGATHLTTVSIPDSVTAIGQSAFRDCTALQGIKIPQYVTKIGAYAFAGTGLTSLTLPSSVTNIGRSVLSGNTGVKYLKIPKGVTSMCETPVLTTIGALKNSAIESVVFEEGMTTIPAYALEGATHLATVSIPDSVTEIGQSAFRDCTSLTSIDLPISISSIGNYVFSGCTSLTSIDLPISITSIGNYAFSGCTSLNKIAIPNTTTSMGVYAFSTCTSLVEVKLPNCRKNITEGMFKNCSSLTKITLPETVTAIRSDAFNGCSSLTHIAIPSGVVTIESSAFANCTSLESITIPGGTKTIGNKAFQNCTALTSATLDDGVTSIGSYIFDGCEVLKEVNLGSGLTKIPDRAFSNCGELESIVIPYRVEEIGANAFLNDVKLTAVTIPRRTAIIASNAFSYPDKLTIYGVAGTYAETYAGEIGAKFVAIDKPATEVTLSQSEIRMNKGAALQIATTVVPADFTDETAWKSSDTSIATVTDAGVVKAVGIGECTVSFVAGNVKASCKITVVQPVTSISLNKTSLSLDAGETFMLTASVYPDNAENKKITWSSSDEAIATVDENGLVTALKKGTATVTAAAEDGSGVQKSCSVTVLGDLHIASSVSDLQSPHPYPVNCNDIWQYSVPGATQLNLTFSTDTSVESGNDHIYIYSADGTLIGKYTGTELAGKTITVPGETVRIKLVSDGTYCEYGFAVTNITTQSGTHTHSYSDTVTAPTCTEQGYTTHTCACGDSYVDSYVDALGHAWDSGVVTKQPTQTEKGEKTYTCTRCGATRTESIPELGHKHQYTETVTAPTCTEKGYTTHTCACGENYVDSYVDALGHAWDNGVVTKQPTQTEKGERTYTCTRCGATRTESIPATGGQTDKPDQPDKPCDGGADCTSRKFVDVSAKDWFHEAVDFAVEQGLFGGMSENTFEPDTPMTRAMLVTVLWRYEGKPEAPANTFSDVKAGTWYADAVSWASANGVVNGVGNNKFDPEGNITREQMATILYRYSNGKGIDTSKQGSLSGFPDAGKVSSYAQTAMQWTVAEGIIGGSDGKLLPQGNATRAQVATILMRFLKSLSEFC